MNDAHHQLDSLVAACDFDIAVGLVTSGGRLAYAHGDLDAPYPLASVSKLISTYAALVAINDGALALTDDAGPEAPQGATVEHLLSHSAGYAFEGGDVLAKVGQRRMYTNEGIEQLARVTERAVGVTFTSWVERSVLEPLGMDGVDATGSPAKDYHASLNDLLVLGQEFMHPTLISPDLAQRARTPHLPELAGVLPGYGRHNPNPWGLGAEIKGRKSPHWTGARNSPRTFGHFGQSGSFLWVDPEQAQGGVSAAFLCSAPFGPAHVELWPPMNDLLIEVGARV